MRIATAAGALLLAQAASVAAVAQEPAPAPPPAAALPKIVETCDRSGGEVVVCGTRERSPYRLPPEEQRFDPMGGVDSVSRERHRLYEVGESGIGSCSTSGPGGMTGCDLIRWKNADEQRGGKKKDEVGVFLKVGPLKRRVED